MWHICLQFPSSTSGASRVTELFWVSRTVRHGRCPVLPAAQPGLGRGVAWRRSSFVAMTGLHEAIGRQSSAYGSGRRHQAAIRSARSCTSFHSAGATPSAHPDVSRRHTSARSGLHWPYETCARSCHPASTTVECTTRPVMDPSVVLRGWRDGSNAEVVSECQIDLGQCVPSEIVDRIANDIVDVDGAHLVDE